MIHFIKNNVIFLLLFFQVGSLFSQPKSIPPRLVVVVMVDGLQQKHIETLWNRFENDGFKRIIDNGASIDDVFQPMVSGEIAATTAGLVTGSVPYYNGISGNYLYNRSTDKVKPVLYDENEIGIGTKLTYSAHYLLSSTIADELNFAYGSRSKIYVVAIQPEAAILLGGHTANSVAWIDDVNSRWVTTGYYKEGLSKSADIMNTYGEFKNMAWRMWEPLVSINSYQFPAQNPVRKNAFYYDPMTKSGSNTLLNVTPWANMLVTELAKDIADKEQLGTDDVPDMLMLQYSVRTPSQVSGDLNTMEKEDIYLRLDRELKDLVQNLTSKKGLENTLFVVFGTPVMNHAPKELGANKIPAGYFNANRSMALLNSYLMALYGNERWVEGYYDKNVYFNIAKIESKKLSIDEMETKAALFLEEFEGIHSVYKQDQVLNASGNPNNEAMLIRNSYHKKYAGDLIISLLPGWIEVDESGKPVGELNAVTNSFPVYFYGWKIKHKELKNRYNSTDVAPTICKILNIAFPNSSIGKPMTEIDN